MLRELTEAILGALRWKRLKTKYSIDENTAVIVFPETDSECNKFAIRYLPHYMKRKNTRKALFLIREEMKLNENDVDGLEIDSVYIPKKDMRLLMKYYCLHRFFDNIVFLFMDYPENNQALEIISKTDVTMYELICLSYYKLREVPTDL